MAEDWVSLPFRTTPPHTVDYIDGILSSYTTRCKYRNRKAGMALDISKAELQQMQEVAAKVERGSPCLSSRAQSDIWILTVRGLGGIL